MRFEFLVKKKAHFVNYRLDEVVNTSFDRLDIKGIPVGLPLRPRQQAGRQVYQRRPRQAVQLREGLHAAGAATARREKVARRHPRRCGHWRDACRQGLPPLAIDERPFGAKDMR